VSNSHSEAFEYYINGVIENETAEESDSFPSDLATFTFDGFPEFSFNLFFFLSSGQSFFQ